MSPSMARLAVADAQVLLWVTDTGKMRVFSEILNKLDFEY